MALPGSLHPPPGVYSTSGGSSRAYPFLKEVGSWHEPAFSSFGPCGTKKQPTSSSGKTHPGICLEYSLTQRKQAASTTSWSADRPCATDHGLHFRHTPHVDLFAVWRRVIDTRCILRRRKGSQPIIKRGDEHEAAFIQSGRSRRTRTTSLSEQHQVCSGLQHSSTAALTCAAGYAPRRHRLIAAF